MSSMQDTITLSSISSTHCLLVMVGLPARGKSYLSNKLNQFLNWRGVSSKTFNVGKSRREKAAQMKQDASFFAPDNAEAKAYREQVALDVLHAALEWLEAGNLAILDATNTTRARRLHLLNAVHERCQAQGRPAPYVIFVEVICNEATVLQSNMRQKVLYSPDFAGMPVEDAMLELEKRIANYIKVGPVLSLYIYISLPSSTLLTRAFRSCRGLQVYETVDEAEEDAASPLGPISYIKIIDLQSKVICRNIWGPMAQLAVQFLMVRV